MASRKKPRVQQAFTFKTWGGKRRGAGRPPKGHRPSEPHVQRERFARTTAVHVTLRVASSVGTLRRRDAYHAVRRATQVVLGRSDFRIVHISLENDHLHAIVEADSDRALAQGIKAFESSAAQRLNRALSKAQRRRVRGTVFPDRYHARLVTSPRQARNAIGYVVNNWRRHKQDQDIDTMFWVVDFFSSGPSFAGWRELDRPDAACEIPAGYQPLAVARPRTWLLDKGWRKAGTISWRDVPGAP
jgi:putative transposase